MEEVRLLDAEKGCTAAQLAIAWVLAQDEDVITIPGSKRISHLEENIGSEAVQLNAGDLQRIEAVMPAGTVAGNRYPEKFMAALGR